MSIGKMTQNQDILDIYKTSFDKLTIKMEKQAFKIINKILACKYLETSGGQTFNLKLNAVYFFNTRLYKTSVAA